MATAAVTYTFANGTNADGTQVNANFTSVVNFLNTETVQRDASIAFTAIPSLPATDPTTDNQAVRKAYVDNHTPAGVITQYGGSTAPTGWLLCQGQAVSRVNTLYSRLFVAIGTNYGVGDGSTTFNVPNLQGRIPVGKDATAEFVSLSQTGGSKTTTLTSAELPAHQHTVGTIAPNTIADHLHGFGTLVNASTDLGSHNHTQTGHTHTVSTSTSSTGTHSHQWGNLPSIQGFITWMPTYGTYSIPQHGQAGTDPLGIAYIGTSELNQGGHSHTSTGSAASTTASNQATSLGSHLHTISGSVANGGGHTHTMSGSTASTGTGTAFSNLPPYIVVNYIIKL